MTITRAGVTPKFKLIIEYDGTDICGWQRQKNDPTIQGAPISAAPRALFLKISSRA